MAAWLATQGHSVNRKRVRRLMRLMGLVAIYQHPNTSKAVVHVKRYDVAFMNTSAAFLPIPCCAMDFNVGF
jgi:hypothetical protein